MYRQLLFLLCGMLFVIVFCRFDMDVNAQSTADMFGSDVILASLNSLDCPL